MTGRSVRDLVGCGNRHRFQQILELLQPADFLDEAKEFVEASGSADGMDSLGYGSQLLEGNRVSGLLFYHYRFGSGGSPLAFH